MYNQQSHTTIKAFRLFVVAALLAVSVAALAPPRPAHAATFTVNTITDADDANPGDGVCDSDAGTAGDQCTLRAAISEANALDGADTITVTNTNDSGAGSLRQAIADASAWAQPCARVGVFKCCQ